MLLKANIAQINREAGPCLQAIPLIATTATSRFNKTWHTGTVMHIVQLKTNQKCKQPTQDVLWDALPCMHPN